MKNIINIEEKLEEKVSNLEDKLESVEENFDQTIARIELKRKNGILTEDDLYEVLDALREHHEGEETITDEIINTEKRINMFKEKSE